MIEELRSADTDAGDVPFLDGERTPAGSARLACALHATAASLAEIRNLLTWFGSIESLYCGRFHGVTARLIL